MAQKYFIDSSGIMTELEAIIVSAGAGSSGLIPALDTSGRLDISFMPVGVGAEVTVAASSENLTAGNFINLYSNAGTINARKADATTSGKPCQGFVLANVTSPANATVYGISTKNTAQSGMTVGARTYLSTTAGAAVSTTPPSATGNIVQYLGIPETAAAIVFSNHEYWVKA